MDNTVYLKQILQGGTIDIMIDDGYHAELPNMRTFESAQPYFAPQFAYFIEDNDKVGKQLRSSYPMYGFDCSTIELTVIYSTL
jgi:hypothetical protein